VKRDEILAMEPGRELDALVAEKVMGLKSIAPNSAMDGEYPVWIPAYSIDIAAAWQVVERMGRTWDMYLSRHYSGRWTCTFDRHGNYLETTVKAGSAPEAICKAALLAVMGSDAE
jgi:hypothetical protein